jgi:ribulose kinase
MSTSYYLGVDVGTGSVRAALVSDAGVVVNKSTLPIKINNPKQGN